MGQTFWLHGIKGTVKGVQRWASTSVQSSGTGTVLKLADGVYQANSPQVSSTTHQHQVFWIVSPGGREWKVEENCDVRDGQNAMVVWGGLRNQNGYNLVLRNCTTNQEWNLKRCLPNSIVFHGVKKLTFRYLVYIFLPLAILLFLYGNAPSRYEIEGGLYSHPSVMTQEDMTPFVSTDIFIVIPILMIVGFVKRCKLVGKNYDTALSAVNQAINSNPQFVKSLEA